jgi:hypothetical protein
MWKYNTLYSLWKARIGSLAYMYLSILPTSRQSTCILDPSKQYTLTTYRQSVLCTSRQSILAMSR